MRSEVLDFRLLAGREVRMPEPHRLAPATNSGAPGQALLLPSLSRWLLVTGSQLAAHASLLLHTPSAPPHPWPFRLQPAQRLLGPPGNYLLLLASTCQPTFPSRAGTSTSAIP